MSFVKAFLFTAALTHFQAGGTFDLPKVEEPPVQQVGTASWYGAGVWHGDVTANGENFDPGDLTCAHRKLPFDTVILVENLANGRRAWCRVNDRGPYEVEEVEGQYVVRKRAREDGSRRGIVDLSVAMARKLRMKEAGLQTVYLRYWTRDRTSSYPLALLQP